MDESPCAVDSLDHPAPHQPEHQTPSQAGWTHPPEPICEQMLEENPNLSVVAKRVKRSEGPIFQTLYQLHKLITFVFTGQNVNFGN